VRFTARVIRIECSEQSRRIGVAAMIENYEFLGAPASGPMLINESLPDS
jgi:hypothetical protein